MTTAGARRAPRPKREHLKGPNEATALDLRSGGRSVLAIAKAVGESVEWVTALIAAEAKFLRDDGRPHAARAVEAGQPFLGGFELPSVPTFDPSMVAPRPRFSSFAKRAAAIGAARLEGHSIVEIGERFGLDPSSVYSW